MSSIWENDDIKDRILLLSPELQESFLRAADALHNRESSFMLTFIKESRDELRDTHEEIEKEQAVLKDTSDLLASQRLYGDLDDLEDNVHEMNAVEEYLKRRNNGEIGGLGILSFEDELKSNKKSKKKKDKHGDRQRSGKESRSDILSSRADTITSEAFDVENELITEKLNKKNKKDKKEKRKNKESAEMVDGQEVKEGKKQRREDTTISETDRKERKHKKEEKLIEDDDEPKKKEKKQKTEDRQIDGEEEPKVLEKKLKAEEKQTDGEEEAKVKEKKHKNKEKKKDEERQKEQEAANDEPPSKATAEKPDESSTEKSEEEKEKARRREERAERKKLEKQRRKSEENLVEHKGSLSMEREKSAPLLAVREQSAIEKETNELMEEFLTRQSTDVEQKNKFEEALKRKLAKKKNPHAAEADKLLKQQAWAEEAMDREKAAYEAKMMERLKSRREKSGLVSREVSSLDEPGSTSEPIEDKPKKEKKKKKSKDKDREDDEEKPEKEKKKKKKKDKDREGDD